VYRFVFTQEIVTTIIQTTLKAALKELKQIMGDDYVEPFPEQIKIYSIKSP
jgi:hypothetical protein